MREMEASKNMSNAPIASKILIDRDKIRKKTIYINPRILKSASKGLVAHEMGVSSVCPDLSKQCNQQYPNVHRQAFEKPNETVSKCVYLNPHFQRVMPNSVHINPKKFSEVMQSSKKSLLNTHPYITKEHENCAMLSSVIPISDKSFPAHQFKTKTCDSQPELHCTNSTNYYRWLPSNKRMSHTGGDRVISTKVRNNLVLKKNGYSNKLIKISDTKLIRMPDKNKSCTGSKTLQKTLVSPTYQMLKKSHNAQDSKSVKRKSEKQKRTLHAALQQTPLSPLPVKHRFIPAVENKGSPSKYKIDRRLVKSRLLRSYKKISPKNEHAVVSHRRNLGVRRLHVSPVLYKSKHLSTSRSLKSNDRMKIVLTSRKLLRIGTTLRTKELKKKKEPTLHTTRLVRIGGVLYRTSRNKLTKSRAPETSTKPSVVKRLKAERLHTIYIRGSKFIMDAKGKTLKQVSRKNDNNCEGVSKSSPIKRIDIGGVTFVKKSSDLLVRTNSHTARNIVNHAKNKSIAMLTNKLRKINQPCAFYRKFGKCPRREKGMCQLVHDPKQVSLCKRFLQGECNINNCLLSHQIVPEKMPTCKYFLEGCCIREECPYLHVKLNSKAVICEKFLQGFCADGSRCKKRHSHLCPDFEKLGTCQKGKYCPYPHKTGVKYNKKAVLNQAKQVKSGSPLGDQLRKRYYQDETNEEIHSRTPEAGKLLKRETLCETGKDTGSSSHSHDLEEAKAHQIEMPVKRPRIGRLPSFIALSH